MLAIPAAVLTGMAFAAPIMAFSATQKTPNKFNAVFRFGITPLFLFSGTFFPLESLPEALRPLAWVTPLYHGAALTRGLSLGHGARRSGPGRRSTWSSWPPASWSATVAAIYTIERTPGARMIALRVTPALAFGSRRSARLVERNLYVYKHGWIVILSGFFEPLFYLLGIGFGLGALVGHDPGTRRRADQLPAVRRPGAARQPRR